MNVNLSRLATFVAIALTPNLAFAANDLPHQFSAGTPANASEVNANFAHNNSIAQEALTKANAAQAASTLAIEKTVNIDCTTNQNALVEQLNNSHGALNVTFTIAGTCQGPLTIQRDGITLSGGAISYDLANANPATSAAIQAVGADRLTIDGVDISVIGEAQEIAVKKTSLTLKNLALNTVSIQANSYAELKGNTSIATVSVNSSSFLKNDASTGNQEIGTLSVYDTSYVELNSITVSQLFQAYGNATALLADNSSVKGVNLGGNAILSLYSSNASGPYNLWGRSMIDGKESSLTGWATSSDVSPAASFGGATMTIDGEILTDWGWSQENIRTNYDSINGSQWQEGILDRLYMLENPPL